MNYLKLFLAISASFALLTGCDGRDRFEYGTEGEVDVEYVAPDDSVQIADDLVLDESGSIGLQPGDIGETSMDEEEQPEDPADVEEIPEEDPEEDPADPSDWDMAILSSSSSGNYVILLMDDAGNELGQVDTGSSWVSDFAWHEGGGFFIVNDGSQLLRVTEAGPDGLFTTAAISWQWRVGVSDDGDVVVADEYEMEQLDEDGVLLMTSPYDSGDCYMDVAFDGSGDLLSLNVYGYSLDTWDYSTNTVTPVVNGIPSAVDYVGTDASGSAWMGSAYGDSVWTVAGNGPGATVVEVGTLGDMGISGVWGVKAVEPAGPSSTYVLYSGSLDDGIVEVTRSGNATLVAAAGGQVWLDLAVR